ncbi:MULTISPECIES: hypothetical protein [Methylosinus]|uniref:hypothetical protein n=1 Tax=Methylosinus TaxID=425 RepID=UPI00046687C6|nr:MULTISPECIES: hypothetical protein [Methylosinus]
MVDHRLSAGQVRTAVANFVLAAAFRRLAERMIRSGAIDEAALAILIDEAADEGADGIVALPGGRGAAVEDIAAGVGIARKLFRGLRNLRAME